MIILWAESNIFPLLNFSALIEQRSITEIENVIKDVLGGWPVRNASWDSNSFNLVSLLVALRRYNTQPIVGIMVRIDSKNSTRNIITVNIILNSLDISLSLFLSFSLSLSPQTHTQAHF